MKKFFLFQVAFFSSLIGLMGIAAFGVLLWDFYFPGTFKDWYLMRHGGLQTNLGLLLLFGIQHSGMARKSFKEYWTKQIPPELERSYYVLFSGFFLFLISILWSPVFPPLFDFSGTVFGYILLGIAGIGLLIIGWSAFLMDGLGLIGFRQILEIVKGRKSLDPSFRTPGIYKYVRHPLYFGMILAFWFTPVMTPDHLLFAVVMTAYLRLGAHFEEMDLVRRYGAEYEEYQARVPMLLPIKMPRKQ